MLRPALTALWATVLVLGCASTPKPQPPPVDTGPSKAEQQRMLEARERAQRAEVQARLQKAAELTAQAADARLLDLPEQERQRARARALAELAQVRYELRDTNAAIAAIDQAAAAAMESGDFKLVKAMNDTRILIYRFIVLELAQAKNYEASLHLLDVLEGREGLTMAQLGRVEDSRMLVKKLSGVEVEEQRDEVVIAALSDLLVDDDDAGRKKRRPRGADAEKEAIPGMTPGRFDLGSTSLRNVIGKRIGNSIGDISESSLPESKDAPIKETGKLDQRTVLAVVSANKKSITACYNKAMRRGREFRGKLEIAADVTPKGVVENAEVMTPEFRDKDIGACIKDAVARWKFPKFGGDQSRHVILPFVLDYFGY